MRFETVTPKDAMVPRISVIVPVFNEEENIAPLAAQIGAIFQDMDRDDFECIFVNDGSTDGTRAVIDRLAVTDPDHFRPLHFTSNFGQSAALIAGLRAAQGEYLLTLDGDLQNDPADFQAFLDLLQDYDCVCGYRAQRQDSPLRRLSSKVANVVRNAVLHDGVRDSGCGTKGFRRHCVRHLIPFNGAHRFFPVLIRAAGLSIAEVSVRHHPRRHGQSKYGVNNRLWRGLYDLLGMAWLRRRYVAYALEGEQK